MTGFSRGARTGQISRHLILCKMITSISGAMFSTETDGLPPTAPKFMEAFIADTESQKQGVILLRTPATRVTFASRAVRSTRSGININDVMTAGGRFLRGPLWLEDMSRFLENICCRMLHKHSGKDYEGNPHIKWNWASNGGVFSLQQYLCDLDKNYILV